MINRSDVFTIHKLWNQGFTKRQIARKLQLDRGTVTKYLASPAPAIQKRRVKQSMLDPYRAMVEEIKEKNCPHCRLLTGFLPLRLNNGTVQK